MGMGVHVLKAGRFLSRVKLQVLLKPLQSASKSILCCIPNLRVLVISTQGPAVRLCQHHYVSCSPSFPGRYCLSSKNASVCTVFSDMPEPGELLQLSLHAVYTKGRVDGRSFQPPKSHCLCLHSFRPLHIGMHVSIVWLDLMISFGTNGG